MYTYARSNIRCINAAAIQEPVHACEGDTVTLQCSDPTSTISVLLGEYGRYATTCDDSCCTPADSDCTENMDASNPTEWQNLKVVRRVAIAVFGDYEHEGALYMTYVFD